jgi:membrane protein
MLVTPGDYVRRVVKGLADDNVFFLAGGLAFSVLLALVPLVLLLIVGLSFALGRDPVHATETVVALAERFLPTDAGDAARLLRGMVDDVLRTRGAIGTGAAIVFVWMSTRLFGSLRAVLGIVLERSERGIVAGKLFDVVASLATAGLVLVWVLLSSYLSIASRTGERVLGALGVRIEALGIVTQLAGSLAGVAVLTVTFYALYHGLPRTRPTREAAWLAAAVTGVLFEGARHLFAWILSMITLNSLYTGTIAVVVSVVFWTYYGSMLFVLGAEVVQVHEQRRESLLL